jgi:hypothetical protein
MLIQNNFVLLSTLSILIVAVLTLNSVYAQENQTTSEEQIKFFAIQHAQSGSISEINAIAYSFELNDVYIRQNYFVFR